MNDPQTDGPDIVSADTPFPATPRIQALDALRGFGLLALLTAVAVGGAMEGRPAGPFGRFVAAQLTPSTWSGLRFGDLFAPWFIFTTGVALALSLKGFTARYGKDASMLRVVRRGWWLYLLGFFCAGGFAEAQSGIPLLGGLQRVALCHGICGFAYIFFRPRTLVVLGALLLFGYWGLLAFAPVSELSGQRWAESQNVVRWFDVRLLARIGFSANRDSAGFLTLIPSLAASLVGLGVGRFLTNPANRSTPSRATLQIALSGLALVVVGAGWSLFCPIIPKLWTSPFVLIASGLCALMLAGFLVLTGISVFTRLNQILSMIGLNSIAIYALSRLMDFEQIASRFLGGNVQALVDRFTFSGAGSLALALLVPAFAILIAALLFNRRLYLRP